MTTHRLARDMLLLVYAAWCFGLLFSWVWSWKIEMAMTYLTPRKRGV